MLHKNGTACQKLIIGTNNDIAFKKLPKW